MVFFIASLASWGFIFHIVLKAIHPRGSGHTVILVTLNPHAHMCSHTSCLRTIHWWGRRSCAQHIFKCYSDGVVKIMCTVVCFTCFQNRELWKLLYQRTMLFSLKRSKVFLRLRSVSLNVIYAARCKIYHLFTLRCYYECALVWCLTDVIQCTKRGPFDLRVISLWVWGKSHFSGSV